MRSFRRFLSTLAEAFHCALQDNCFFLARAAAYSAVLALFPGLIFVSGLLFSQDAKQTIQDLSLSMGEVLPPAVHEMLTAYLSVPVSRSSTLMFIAAAAAVLFATEMIWSLMEGFRAAYRARRRKPVWKDYGIALSLVFFSILPLALANVSLIFARQIEAWVRQTIGERWWLVETFRFSWWAIALITMTVTVSALYYVAPNREQRVADVLPGAALAAGLWAATTALFTFYVQHIARYSDLYGSVSTVIVLLIWLYLVNAIVLVGCEFNAARDRRTGLAPLRTPEHH